MWKVVCICFIIFCCRSGKPQETLNILNPKINLKSLDISSGRRIVGGSESSVEKFPFVVQIFVNSHLFGGGTILSHRHILTCAHILVNKKTIKVPVRKFAIRSGTSTANSDYQNIYVLLAFKQGGTVTGVSNTSVHPNFSMDIYFDDIGLIFLETPLEFKSNQGPAALAHKDLEVPDGALVTVMGWGRGRDGPVTNLQEVTIPIVNHDECVRRFQTQGHNITDDMICAGVLDVGDKDTCQGDSGGPLVYLDILVGVTSWGVDCGHPVYPGIYTRVAKYLDWIQNETGLVSQTGVSVEALRTKSGVRAVYQKVSLSFMISLYGNIWFI